MSEINLSPTQLGALLDDLATVQLPTMIFGPPGIGKSSIVFQAAARRFDGERNRYCSAVGGFPEVPWFLAVRALDRDPIDFRGVLYVVDGKARMTMPDILDRLRASERGGVLVIEELPQALPAVQCVLREAILERSLGGVRLPDNWWVLATGNRREDRAGAGRLLSHVQSALLTVELAPNLEDWLDWSSKRGVHEKVRAFLKFRPDLLCDFDPRRDSNTDPRGWERVADILDSVRPSLRTAAFGGIVTTGAAAEFLSFLEVYEHLPNIDDVLARPGEVALPSSASVIWALTGALLERCRAGNKSVIRATSMVAERIPEEFATRMMLDVMRIAPRAAPQVHEFVRWAEAHGAVEEQWKAISEEHGSVAA